MFAEYYFLFYNGKHDSNSFTANYQIQKQNSAKENDNECSDDDGCVDEDGTTNEHSVSADHFQKLI